ncbi:MAG: CPBP family intramembrane glutamic endopeptidase [Flavobacteriaceae bacterium]|nr:CPBP family intramembrane glutamic endopeptidase [Flavobacteriaceae bacterium]
MVQRYKRFLWMEMFFLFVLGPVMLLFDIYPVVKIVSVLIGLSYVVVLIFKSRKRIRETKKRPNWQKFWRSTGLKFSTIAVGSIIALGLYQPDLLFKIVREKPWVWVSILFVYSIVSVYPQEVLYRVFFFSRYEILFSNKRLLLFINAFLFSLAHIIFLNVFVLLVTFVGGLLFAYTYHHTRSTSMVFLEHTIYGYWIFTVGMGGLLGFPT